MPAVTPVRISEAMLVEGLATPRFFNGRLLSGEALTQARDAERAQRERLGRAVGDGVVDGLVVRAATGARLAVSAGLCVNRDGATLRLPIDVEVSFESAGADGVARAAGAFADCLPVAPAGSQAVPGAYVLVLGPAAGTRGRAPVSGQSGNDACCNVRDDVEGVRFRIAPVIAPTAVAAAMTDANRRDAVAQLCFGTRAPTLRDPGFDARPQCLTAEHRITNTEVPLAAFRWNGLGFDFVDVWAARRFVAPPAAEDVRWAPAAPTPAEPDPWSGVVGARRRALCEAMFLQFQEHLRDAPGITAAASRVWLPPVGCVTAAAWRTFLGALAPTSSTAVAGVSDLRALIRRGLDLDPIPVGSAVPVSVFTHGSDAVFTRAFTPPSPP